MTLITVERKVLKKNDELAAENRNVFSRHKVFALNLLSSPGAGKTTLLEKLIPLFAGRARVGVIEGDVQTDRDAQRIAQTGVPVVQIVTNGGCHLDASLVHNAIENIALGELDVLFIENVGNLVCPASFDLGERLKITIASVTEGDDKPIKYPKVFRVSNACVLNKTDLLPYVDFEVERFHAHAEQVNAELTHFTTSARTGEGLEELSQWILSNVPSDH